jgi:hypothetical protein
MATIATVCQKVPEVNCRTSCFVIRKPFAGAQLAAQFNRTIYDLNHCRSPLIRCNTMRASLAIR